MKIILNKIFKNLLRYDKSCLSQDQKNAKFINSVLAFTFLFSFMFIEKIPVEWVLITYGFFSDEAFKIGFFVLSIFILWLSYDGKFYGYSLSLIIFALGHFLFINVYADKYSLSNEPVRESLMNEKHLLPKIQYSEYWNMG